MRKIISMILAMVMIVTTFGAMTAFAKVADTTVGDFRYSVYELYNEDFERYEVDGLTYGADSTNKSFQGLDNDVYYDVLGNDISKGTTEEIKASKEDNIAVNPTKFQYIERTDAKGGTALKLFIDDSVNYTNTPYMSVYASGNKFSSAEGAKALVTEFDIMFPVIPKEPNQSVYLWSTSMHTSGNGKFKYFYMSTSSDITTDETGEVTSADITKFSFRSGNKFQNIDAEKYYKVTQVIDFDEMLMQYYIDGVLLGEVDLSSYGAVTGNDYMRIAFPAKSLAKNGICIDNYHYYYATDVAPVIDNTPKGPYPYVAYGNGGFDFEGYTINGSNALAVDGVKQKV